MNIKKTAAQDVNTVFYNHDYAANSHTFTANAKAGDIVELDDGSIGICVHEIDVEVNPNGAVAYRGIVDERRIADDQKPTAAQVEKAGGAIKWRKSDGTYDGGTV